MREDLLVRLRESTARARARAKALTLLPGPCRHLGPPTGEGRPCPSCGRGTLMVPLHACARHGACAERRQLAGVACCRTCPDREARDG